MQIKPGKVCSHYIVSSTQKPTDICPKSTVHSQFSKEATRVLSGDLGTFCLQHSWLGFPLAPELEQCRVASTTLAAGEHGRTAASRKDAKSFVWGPAGCGVRRSAVCGPDLPAACYHTPVRSATQVHGLGRHPPEAGFGIASWHSPSPRWAVERCL